MLVPTLNVTLHCRSQQGAISVAAVLGAHFHTLNFGDQVRHLQHCNRIFTKHNTDCKYKWELHY